MTSPNKLTRKLLLAVFALLPVWASAQRVSLKTNALGWLTLSPNMAAELRMSRHYTLNLDASVGLLKLGKYKTNHIAFAPEVRYWFSARPQTRHFVGVMAIGADYDWRLKDTCHKGDALGAGITYGYCLVLDRRWSIEATAGAGLLHQRDRKFAADAPQPAEPNNSKTRLAPLKLGLSVAYILK